MCAVLFQRRSGGGDGGGVASLNDMQPIAALTFAAMSTIILFRSTCAVHGDSLKKHEPETPAQLTMALQCQRTFINFEESWG